jgi:hypothetical protein
VPAGFGAKERRGQKVRCSMQAHDSGSLISISFLINYKCLKCHGCVAEAVSALPGALVGRLLHVCAMCTMCTFLACWWCRVCFFSQHPQQTQHAKCVGGKATTHAPAHRGAQLYSQFSSNNHRGDSRGVASVVSLATRRARTRSIQQQQQQQQSTQQEGSTCVSTARG